MPRLSKNHLTYKVSVWLRLGIAGCLLGGFWLVMAGCAAAESSTPTQTVIFVMENSSAVRVSGSRESQQALLKNWMRCFSGDRYNVHLILFGNRSETFVEAVPTQYSGTSRFCDFAAALEATTTVLEKHPSSSNKVILITAGRQTIDPKEWPVTVAKSPEPPQGKSSETLESIARRQTLLACKKLPAALYVVVVGNEPDIRLIREMTQQANGRLLASPPVEYIADRIPLRSHWLQQYVCNLDSVPSQKQTRYLENYFQLVAAPPVVALDVAVVALFGMLVVCMMSVSVRSFPGPGDSEWLELLEGEPLYLGTGIENAMALVQASAALSPQGIQVCRGPELASLGLVYRTRAVHLLGYRQCNDYEQLDSLSKQLVLLDPKRVAEGLLRAAQGLADDDDTMRAVQWRLKCNESNISRIQQTLQQIDSQGAVNGEDLVYTKLCLAFFPELTSLLGSRYALFWVSTKTGEETKANPQDSVRVGHHRLTLSSILEIPVLNSNKLRIQLTYAQPGSGLTLKRFFPVTIQGFLRLRRSRTHILVMREE